MTTAAKLWHRRLTVTRLIQIHINDYTHFIKKPFIKLIPSPCEWPVAMETIRYWNELIKQSHGRKEVRRAAQWTKKHECIRQIIPRAEHHNHGLSLINNNRPEGRCTCDSGCFCKKLINTFWTIRTENSTTRMWCKNSSGRPRHYRVS